MAGRIVVIGCVLGVAGLSLFAGLHALVIKPVWSQLLGGLPFVIAIGITVTWAYHEFVKVVPNRICSTGGLRFGATMWLSAWPATAFANLMRIQRGGPLPVLRGGGVAELWFGLFVLETAAGVILAKLYKRFIAPIAPGLMAT